MSSSIRRSARGVRRLRILAAGALLAALGAATPGSALAGDPIRFDVVLGSCPFRIFGAPTMTYKVTLQRTGHPDAGPVSITINGDGYQDVGCDLGAPRTGSTLVVKLDEVLVESLTLPPLTMTFSRTADTVTGTTASGRTVSSFIDACAASLLGCDLQTVPDATSSGTPGSGTTTGLYVVDGDGFDIRGGSPAELSVDIAEGDTIRARRTVPFFQVQKGRSRVTGNATPGSSVTVRFLTGSGKLRGKGTAKAASDGRFSATVKRDGKAVTLRVGDRAAASFLADAKLTLPAVSMTVDKASGEVTGTCFPNQRVAVQADPATIGPTMILGTTAGADGTFATDVGEAFTAGTVVGVFCGTANGDVVRQAKTVP